MAVFFFGDLVILLRGPRKLDPTHTGLGGEQASPDLSAFIILEREDYYVGPIKRHRRAEVEAIER